MQGKEIYDMIVKLNRDAKIQGGRLKSLALPQELYDELVVWANEHLRFYSNKPTDGLYIDGVKIHTGEDD